MEPYSYLWKPSLYLPDLLFLYYRKVFQGSRDCFLLALFECTMALLLEAIRSWGKCVVSSEPWVQPCKDRRWEMSSHRHIIQDSSPLIPVSADAIEQWGWLGDAKKDPFQMKWQPPLLLQEPLLLWATIPMTELQKMSINKKQWEPFWDIFTCSATVCTHCDNPNNKVTYIGFSVCYLASVIGKASASQGHIKKEPAVCCVSALPPIALDSPIRMR